MNAITLRDLEREAEAKLDPAVLDFFRGGADDEVTLRDNEEAFRRLRLLPRVLRGGGAPQLECELLGARLACPVFVAPTAFHKLAHPLGEIATARATARAGSLLIASMAATCRLEDIAAAARAVDPHACLWLQIYLQPDRGFTEAIAQRAAESGYRALVVTVDSPAFGRRDRDVRNRFSDLPPGLACENMRDARGELRAIAFSPELSWRDVEWLRTRTDLPIVLKGVARPEDALIAARSGVAAIAVSNHGGRQLDGMPAAIDLLPGIIDAVQGAVPVLVDGGVRRGTDVVKALALGAAAVGLGRPILWGLACDGEEGVAKVLSMMNDELARALALMGVAGLDELEGSLLVRGGSSW